MTIKFREFTEDDWDVFGGAEKPKGTKPLIAEIKVVKDDTIFDAVCVIDHEGISIEMVDEDCAFIGGYNLEMQPFKSAVFYAKKFLKTEMADKFIKKYGFVSY